MVDLIIALLTLYLGFCGTVATISLVRHWLPVIYSLRQSGNESVVAKYPTLGTLIYWVIGFVNPFTLFMPSISTNYSRLYKDSLYKYLKDV